jgi:hypothetical protein
MHDSLILLKLKLVDPLAWDVPLSAILVGMIRRGRGTITASVEKDSLFLQ